jgi:uncharacterized membrane protein
MNEANALPQEQQSSERYKSTIIILTVFTTVLAALLAALQVDASIRADIANRNSQYLAVLASGELHRAGLEGNYEFNIFGDYLTNLQETTVLELTALEQEEKGDLKSAQASRELALIAQARAEVGRKFSIFYNDPRYAPQTEDGLPAAEQYIADLNESANEIVARQNAASDEYRKWDAKADSYVTMLTILAVAFFLFGLAQVVRNLRFRLTFIIFGLIVVSFSLLFSAIILLG